MLAVEVHVAAVVDSVELDDQLPATVSGRDGEVLAIPADATGEKADLLAFFHVLVGRFVDGPVVGHIQSLP